jgi:hypothetical protein
MKAHQDEIAKLTSALRLSNDLLRSAYSIAKREGKNTHWKLFEHQLLDALFDQRDLLFTPSTNATNPVYARATAINPAGKIDVLVLNSVQKEQWKDIALHAWSIISNVGCGDWDKQNKEWRDAAGEFCKRLHAAIIGVPEENDAAGEVPPGKYKDTIDWLQSDVSGVVRMHDGWTVWDVRDPARFARNKDLITAVGEIIAETMKPKNGLPVLS